MDPKEPQDLLLDDIMNDFSPDDLSLEEIMKEFAPEVPQEASAVTGDTIRLDKLPDAPPNAPVSTDTLVFEAPQEPETPAQEPPEEPNPPEPPAKAAEPEPAPFSADWEPEYEEPMGEYQPQEPIPFPPKNRLRTMRQKLVAGPEKRFFELSALGLGKLRLGIILNLVLFALSAGITVAYSNGSIGADQIRLVIFSQLLFVMLSALVGCYRLLGGLGDLLKGRFTLNSLLLITFVVCVADGFSCLYSQRIPCCALFCLDMVMAQWAARQYRGTQMSQMDTLRKAPDLTAIVKIEDYYDGRPGYKTMEGDPDSYTQHYSTPSAPEKSLWLYALMALVVSGVMALVTGINRGLDAGLQVLSAALLLSMPATAYISMTRPAAILERRLHRLGAVLCGWQGIQAAESGAVYPLEHRDLFPEDTVKMNGVKFFGSIDPGRVVSYTSALISMDGQGLTAAFAHLPRSRQGLNHRVEEFTVYSGGIGGRVDGDTVLVGTAEFMAEMDIPIPQDAQVPLAIYTAVEGQFSGVFALSYSRSKSSAAGLRILCGYRGITPVLTACDFMLTPRFIHSQLSVNIHRLVFPKRETRQALAQTGPDETAPVIALTTREGLAPKACAVSGARILQSSMRIGALIHILGGGIGLLAMAVLLLTNGLHLLTPLNLLVYNTIWMLPGLLTTEWTRYI